MAEATAGAPKSDVPKAEPEKKKSPWLDAWHDPVAGMSCYSPEGIAERNIWADMKIVFRHGGDYVAAAGKAAGELYGYGHSNVLFKPTKAKDVQFRPMAGQAMSYFVGSKAVGDGISEDGGFAINGGKGWSDVVFDNHQIDLNGNVAIAMGNYYFTSAADGSKTKPTKAKDVQFRPMASQAMSYFVGSKAVGDGISEDGGFAINGGKGWSDVVFDNHQIDLNGNVAIAMGNYYFTSAADGSKTKVEYTFGYKKNEDGKARIFLHHSSVPFQV
eukprot:symbB.v1.2.030919.t1/scaffold3535.1/size54508/2